MYSEFYSDGTVSLTNGSAAVVGSGTAWNIFGVAGGVLFVGDRSFPIASVEDDNHLTLRRASTVTTSNADYDIGLVSAVQVRSLQANTLASEILARNVAFAFDADAAGSLGDRGAHDGEPEGFRYGVFDDPEHPVFYRKASDASADWAGPFKWRGPAGATGPAGALLWVDEGWTSGTAYVVNNGLSHNGTSYRATAAHTSSAATEPGAGADWETVWEVAAAKGDLGPQGPQGDTGATGPQGARGVTWRGDWNSSDTYSVNHVVVDDDGDGQPAAWIAKAENTNSRPRDNASDWDLFPASFPTVVDYGDFSGSPTDFLDYGDFS